MDQQRRQLAVTFILSDNVLGHETVHYPEEVVGYEQNLTLHAINFVGLTANIGVLLFEYFKKHKLRHNGS